MMMMTIVVVMVITEYECKRESCLGGDKLTHSPLYISMKLPQQKPLVIIVNANLKIFKLKYYNNKE
jgi:hypothetical protein